jgi:hypothetical protein
MNPNSSLGGGIKAQARKDDSMQQCEMMMEREGGK